MAQGFVGLRNGPSAKVAKPKRASEESGNSGDIYGAHHLVTTTFVQMPIWWGSVMRGLSGGVNMCWSAKQPRLRRD